MSIPRLGVVLLAVLMPLCSGTLVGEAVKRDLLFERARLVLSLGERRVLVLGGMGPVIRDVKWPEYKGAAAYQPGEDLLVLPRGVRYVGSPSTNWSVGDNWKFYGVPSGAVEFTISSLGALRSTCTGNAWAVAFGDLSGVSSVVDLDRNVFLGVPAGERIDVTSTGLAKVPDLSGGTIDALLQAHARAAMKGDLWHARRGNDIDPRIRRMNRAFLGGEGKRTEINIKRSPQASGASVLFVSAICRTESGEPLFAADAAFEEAALPKPIYYSDDKAALMRESEYKGAVWRLEPLIMNAWAIGNRRFVVRYLRSYEERYLDVMEMVPGNLELKPVGISHPSGGC